LAGWNLNLHTNLKSFLAKFAYENLGEIMLDDWQNIVVSIYQILQITINAIKAFGKIRKAIPKEYSVAEIRDNLLSGELHFGDKIKVIGTFSEYLPFIDLKLMLETGKFFPRTLPRTVRLEPIEDIYCGSLFPLDQKDAFADETIPIFYGIDSRMVEHHTGEMLEVKCKITQVPRKYHQIINQGEFFVFEKEEGVTIPFGLQILEVDPYGLVDSFKINAWVIGNLSPSPSYETKKKDCLNCERSFSFMGIDPLDWPPKLGCTLFGEMREDKKLIKQWSKEFLNLDKKGVPYVVFPDPFRLFEIFHSNVDLLSAEEMDHCSNLLIGAIQKNMQKLFDFGVGIFSSELKMPEEIGVNVDFQYDQRKKLSKQSFDPSRIPEWTCPNYVYDPKWKERARTRKSSV